MVDLKLNKEFPRGLALPKLRPANMLGTSRRRYNIIQSNKNGVLRGGLSLKASGTRRRINTVGERAEIFKSMEEWAKHNLLPLLKPVSESWQPQDFLPDPACEGFHDQLRDLRARTQAIPDDFFVVLVGDMVTEEALPSYHSRLNGTEAFHDRSGVDDTPWAVWTRGWSAEENRHGDLLNKYLYLSGRVDMKQVETTIHHLIANGVDVGGDNDPYLTCIYTSFQERATAISHANTAKLAMRHGDSKLAKICGTIAADEKRHEAAYSRIAAKLFDIDPDAMVLAFAHMMRRKIAMPAHLMYDGRDHQLFLHFSTVASRLGVYTASDYRLVLDHFVRCWSVERLTGLSADARQAQDYVCGLAHRLLRLEEVSHSKVKQSPPVSFSWIFDRLA